jgi:hypothetical protein
MSSGKMEELQAETEEFRKGKFVTLICMERKLHTYVIYAGNECARMYSKCSHPWKDM